MINYTQPHQNKGIGYWCWEWKESGRCAVCAEDQLCCERCRCIRKQDSKQWMKMRKNTLWRLSY